MLILHYVNAVFVLVCNTRGYAPFSKLKEAFLVGKLGKVTAIRNESNSLLGQHEVWDTQCCTRKGVGGGENVLTVAVTVPKPVRLEPRMAVHKQCFKQHNLDR